MKHMTEDVLLRLLDGELTENEAAFAREHARSCGSCSERMRVQQGIFHALRAPVPQTRDARVLVDELMSRVVREDAVARRSLDRKASWWSRGGVVAACVAVAAGVAFFFGKPRASSEFTARGGALSLDAGSFTESRALSREVGVRVVYADGAELREVNGAMVPVDAGYAAVVRNAGNDTAYALVFALDAASVVHWIAPMYVDPSSDPASTTIAPRTEESVHKPIVAFDRPASGRLRFFAVISRRPKHVSDVERREAPDLEVDRLRGRLGDVIVEELGAATVRR